MDEPCIIPAPQPDRFDVRCKEHRLWRCNLTYLHAASVLAKHLREQHNTTEQWPDLNLSAVATLVLMSATVDLHGPASDPGILDTAATVLGMWESLTGLPRTEAIALAQRVQSSTQPVVAAVIPL